MAGDGVVRPGRKYVLRNVISGLKIPSMLGVCVRQSEEAGL